MAGSTSGATRLLEGQLQRLPPFQPAFRPDCRSITKVSAMDEAQQLEFVDLGSAKHEPKGLDGPKPEPGEFAQCRPL